MGSRTGWSFSVLLAPAALSLAIAPAAQVGAVASEQKISETEGGFGGTIDPLNDFGQSVASLGDLDGDGPETSPSASPRR